MPKRVDDLGVKEADLNKQSFIEKVNDVDASAFKGKFHYSGVGAELLSYILEAVYKKPFDTILKQTLSRDAGMSNTQVDLSYPQMPYFAYGYNDKGEIAKSHTSPNKLWGGRGFIKSSMKDLTKFMKLQLQEEQPVIALSHERLFDFEGGSGSFAYLWIVIEDEKLGTFLVHHGGLQGTQNWMMVFLDHELAISVISNSSFKKMDQLLREFGWKTATLLIEPEGSVDERE